LAAHQLLQGDRAVVTVVNLPSSSRKEERGFLVWGVSIRFDGRSDLNQTAFPRWCRMLLWASSKKDAPTLRAKVSDTNSMTSPQKDFLVILLLR
jgi:hypothetical protein